MSRNEDRDAKEFVLKPEHIQLLARAYVDWQDCETGAPEIDPKRPYGNSSVAFDVAEIIGQPLRWVGGSEYSGEIEPEQEEALLALHRETCLALQVVLATKSFEPGLYRREQFMGHDWKRVGSAQATGGDHAE